MREQSFVTPDPEPWIELAGLGYWLVPLRPGSKIPAVEGWKSKRSRDFATLRSWAKAGLNAGIATEGFGDGNESLVVLDVDNKNGKDGTRALAELARNRDGLDGTYVQTTPSGGVHLPYRTSRRLKHGANRLGPGLDVITRGQIVAAGSVYQGKAYAAPNGIIAPAQAPAWLEEKIGETLSGATRAGGAPPPGGWLNEDPVAIERAIAAIKISPPSIAGNRNNTLVRIAMSCGDYGLSQSAAEALIREHWPTDLDGDEFARTIASAYRSRVDAVGSRAAKFEPVSQSQTSGPLPIHAGSDVELARRLVVNLRARHGELAHCEGSFWFHDRTHWKALNDTTLRRMVHEMDGLNTTRGKRVAISSNRVTGVLREAAAMLDHDGKFFAASSVGINVTNGFLAFSQHDGSVSLRPHAADDRCRYALEVDWRPDVDWRRKGSFLGKLLDGCFAGDPERDGKITLLSEVFGCAALGFGTRLHSPKAVVLLGRQAGNGKSTVLEVMRALLPLDATISLPPAKFGDERHTVHLVGKLLNAADELGSGQVIASDKFKAIVTGDVISARDVYRPKIDFQPRALHVFATNALPSFSQGMDAGVRRRLLPIEFNRTIPPAERVPEIAARIRETEMDLLLAFAVEGAQRILRTKAFTELPSSVAAMSEWTEGADPVLAWITARCEFELAARVTKTDAYRDFLHWSETEGHHRSRLPSRASFVQRVRGADPRIGEPRSAFARQFSGIRLSDTSGIFG